MSDRIFVPLATSPFQKFKCGSKGVEIRQIGSPVASAVLNHDVGTPVLLRRGYSTSDEIHGRLGLWVTADSLGELPVEFRIAADLDEPNSNRDYYDARRPVVAFQVLDVAHWQAAAKQGGNLIECGAECRASIEETESLYGGHDESGWFLRVDDDLGVLDAFCPDHRPMERKPEESTNREATPSPTVAGEHQEQESLHQSGPDASEAVDA